MKSKIITFLAELEKNNNKEWFHAHRMEREEADREFEYIIERLILEIGRADSSILSDVPKDLTFKLNRDTRFSHDKSPYLPAFRCHIGPAGKLPVPVGYYLYIRPGQSFLGGGLFADMFKDATALIRDAINRHGDEFERIITAPEFQTYLRLQGTALKNVPKEYDADHPQAQYLKYKSWFIELPFEDELLDDADAFAAFAAERYLRMKPFHDFLNQALKDFRMPER